VGTSSNSTWHACHSGGHPSKHNLGPTLLVFADQMGTGMHTVARGRFSTFLFVASGQQTTYLVLVFLLHALYEKLMDGHW
jgi:hypothetical protein